MLSHVERKHWYTQLPLSWGVAAVLVLALLAGAAFASTEIGRRAAIITDQSAVISQQTATLDAYREITTSWELTAQQYVSDLLDQRTIVQQQGAIIQRSSEQMSRLAAVDSAVIEAYGTLQAQRAALEKARRGEYGEVYESTAIAEAAVAQTQSHLETLLAQRQMVLTHLNGYEP